MRSLPLRATAFRILPAPDCVRHALARHGTGPGLGGVLADVAEPDGFLSRWFRTVILEYDLAASRAPEAEAPGVFLEPHGSLLDPRASSTPSARGRGVTCGPRIVTSAVCRAVGRETDPAECGAIERVHRALPRTVTTEHLGALPGREPRAVRLVVAMPKTAGRKALTSLAPPHSPAVKRSPRDHRVEVRRPPCRIRHSIRRQLRNSRLANNAVTTSPPLPG